MKYTHPARLEHIDTITGSELEVVKTYTIRSNRALRWARSFAHERVKRGDWLGARIVVNRSGLVLDEFDYSEFCVLPHEKEY